MSEDLEALEPWLKGYLARLTPARRIAVARRIGIMLRRENSLRIRANVQPDGSAMPARKPQRDREGKLRKRKARMFARLGLLRSMRVRAREDEVAVDFQPRVAKTARVHHFGLVDQVDRRVPGSLRVRYAQRRLLGLAPGDREAIMDEAISLVEG